MAGAKSPIEDARPDPVSGGFLMKNVLEWLLKP